MFEHDLRELRLDLLRIASSGGPLVDGRDAAGIVEAASCLEKYVLSGAGTEKDDGLSRDVSECKQVIPVNALSSDEHRVGMDVFPLSGSDGNHDVSRKGSGGIVNVVGHNKSPVVGIDTATVSEGGDGVKPSSPEAA